MTLRRSPLPSEISPLAKRSTTKKTTKKAPAKKVTKKAAKKAPAKKVTKKAAKKAPAKKVTKKAAKKAPAKKVTKKAAKKAPAKKVTKKAAKKVTKKAAKKASAKKATKKQTKAGDDTLRPTGGAALAAAARGRQVVLRTVAEVAAQRSRENEEGNDGYIIVNGRRVRVVQAKKLPVKKARRSRAVATPAPEANRLKKTPLKAAELREYQAILLQARAQLAGSIEAKEASALGDSDTSKLPLHMADVGSDAYAQDLDLNLAEGMQSRLAEIDSALMRIKEKSYGICEHTGKAIPKKRLNAKPWARYTIEAANVLGL
ncbi:MAG: TraR/DksA family transcriptional regulator [Phycisphaeraceae bacterium]|nr:MAG: TraR/DksA family transcriptional regulator [Phycisphaeraceae bacterium]